MRCSLSSGDADARVFYLEVQSDRQGFWWRLQLNIEQNLARLSELERVADQVDHDLAKPAGVSRQEIWYVRGHVASQFDDVAMSPHGE